MNESTATCSARAAVAAEKTSTSVRADASHPGRVGHVAAGGWRGHASRGVPVTGSEGYSSASVRTPARQHLLLSIAVLPLRTEAVLRGSPRPDRSEQRDGNSRRNGRSVCPTTGRGDEVRPPGRTAADGDPHHCDRQRGPHLADMEQLEPAVLRCRLSRWVRGSTWRTSFLNRGWQVRDRAASAERPARTA